MFFVIFFKPTFIPVDVFVFTLEEPTEFTVSHTALK